MNMGLRKSLGMAESLGASNNKRHSHSVTNVVREGSVTKILPEL